MSGVMPGGYPGPGPAKRSWTGVLRPGGWLPSSCRVLGTRSHPVSAAGIAGAEPAAARHGGIAERRVSGHAAETVTATRSAWIPDPPPDTSRRASAIRPRPGNTSSPWSAVGDAVPARDRRTRGPTRPCARRVRARQREACRLCRGLIGAALRPQDAGGGRRGAVDVDRPRPAGFAEVGRLPAVPCPEASRASARGGGRACRPAPVRGRPSGRGVGSDRAGPDSGGRSAGSVGRPRLVGDVGCRGPVRSRGGGHGICSYTCVATGM
ncbi:hypothetical protein FHR81_003139 [Actinoalloteichus hoggarensis]|uniref:Uncharacterized protein n=1 Tax=Actinoalloteichus hoggarensis TaxID=1470176 RepID=A0A221W6H5_9PSEU|nr:hypothetical protein AHOG_19380 [Actinoalloteichus hoggarensis]MBB5922087.1 hypothetical protein [Actinoalloteichus hoggarensis]